MRRVLAALGALSGPVAVLLVIAVGGAVAALVFAATTQATVAIAAYAAVLTTYTLIRSTQDRPNLQVTARLNPNEQALIIRLVNLGRRPVRIERVGASPDKRRMTSEWLFWQSDSASRRQANGEKFADPLPVDLPESGSEEVWTWLSNIDRDLGQVAPRYAFAQDSRGVRHWCSVPTRTAEVLSAVREKARVDKEKLDAITSGMNAATAGPTLLKGARRRR